MGGNVVAQTIHVFRYHYRASVGHTFKSKAYRSAAVLWHMHHRRVKGFAGKLAFIAFANFVQLNTKFICNHLYTP